MTLTVLTDAQIKSILENLTLSELQSALDALRSALHEYSTGSQHASSSSESIHQPERTSVNSPATGATTLFMPSSSSLGTGVKVITLSSSYDAASASSSSSSSSTPQTNIKPTGGITLFSPYGTPIGFLHASTLTAFRTALASLCLVARRTKVTALTVFGTGEQAYWHVRLTLLLRGKTIKRVQFVNRQFSDSCRDIMRRFLGCTQKDREGWEETRFEVLTRGHLEYERLLEKELLESDVIFCCTPSKEALWKEGLLTSREGRRRGRLIVAIGSWTREMREIPGDVIRQALKKGGDGGGDGHGHRHHWHKHAVEGGVVVVDTLDGALKEAGELIEAGVGAEELVELGELVMLREIILAESEVGGGGEEESDEDEETVELGKSSSKASKRKAGNKHLAKWLQKGNVIYKSVGLGLMDLTVGMHVVKLAKEKGVGSHIEGF